MAKALPLPDGTTVAIREGETPEQTWERAQRMYPEAFGGRKETGPKQDTSGFKAAASAGATRLGGEFELLKGKLGVKSEAEAQKEYEAAQAKAAARFTPTEKGWTEDFGLKFRETLGGSLPYAAAPAAAGLAALALPVSAPVALGAGLLGAGAVSTGQFTGSNLAAQMDTGKTLEEASLGKAAAAAVPQALIDTAAMALLPGVGKLFSSVGSKLTTEQAKAIASQTLTRTIGDYTAKTGMAMGREGITEATQQLLERLQAGLEITDVEARKEYVDSFIGGAVLGGTLAPAGRAFERGGAKRQAAQAERAEEQQRRAQQKAQEDAADQALEQEKQTPDYAIKIGQQYDTLFEQFKTQKAAIKKPGKDATPVEKAEYKDAQDQLTALNSQLKELVPEYRRTAALRAQELEKQRVAGMTPEEYMLEQTQAVPITKERKDVKPDLEGYYEQQIAVPAAKVDPLQQYVAQRLGLMEQQSPTTDPEDYISYLMQDPDMARQLLANRVALPGFKRKELNELYDDMQLLINELDEQQAEQKTQLERVRGQMTGAAPGADIMGAARQTPAVQAAEEQRAADEARLRVVTPEIEGIQRLGQTPDYSPAQALRQSYETRKASEQQDEDLVNGLLATLPQGGMITPGQVFQGLGGGTMRERSDLLTQLAIARETSGSSKERGVKDNEISRGIVEKLRALKTAEVGAGTGEQTAPMQTVLAGISVPEARAKEAAANKYVDQQNEQLLALTRMLGKVNQGTLVLPDTFKQRTDAAKQAYFEHHANEIDARRDAFGLPPMAAWERGEARARVMEALNELGDRWGSAASAGPAGQRQFGSQLQAVAALQEQMRTNIQKTVAGAAERAKLGTTNELAEKTGATPTQYYTEDAAGNKTPIEVPQEKTQRRIAAPAELTLREEKKPASVEDTIQALLDTADTRQRAVPTTAVKPVKKVSNLADISQLLEKERSDGTLEPMSEGSISLLQKLQEVLPQTSDAEFRTLAGKIVRQIQTGNEPNLFDVRDLNEMSLAMEAAGQSATRAGATQEELQRTSAQPQLDLFPEAEVQTQRATPRNFQKLLDSKNIQGLREAIEQQRADNQAALEQARDNLPKLQTALDKARADYDAALKRIQEVTPDKLALEKSAKQETEGIAEVLEGLRFTKRNIEQRLAEIQQMREGIYAAGESNAMFGNRATIEAANAFKDEPALRKRLENVNEALENAGALQKAIQQMQAGEKAFLEKGEAASTAAESAFDESKKILKDAQQTANDLRRLEEQKKAPTTDIGTSDAEYRAVLQRAREGLNLPGRRNLVDTTAMKQTIFNLRSAMGSFDAQLENKNLTEEKRAEIQAKRDNAAKQLESVYENAPRITTEIKEDGQLDLERAFDDAQAKAYDKQIAKRRARAGESPPVLPSSKSGPVVKGVRNQRISQSGEKSTTLASESAGTALEKLAEERAKLVDLERREKFLRDNGKAKSGGRLTPTFKALQDQITKQKAVVAQAAEEQGKIVAEVRETKQALGSKEVMNLGRKEAVGLKEDEASIPKPPKVVFRTVTRGPTSLQTEQVQRLADRVTKDWVNAPDIVVVATEADLPVRIRGQIVREDRAEGTTPGLFDTKTKKVYLIASNLSNANDVILTIAHEVTGHYGLREMLGGTYNATMNRLYDGNPAVRKQADAKLKSDPNLSREVAVEEVLAEMAEDPNPTPAEKSALRQLYERIRTWLRSKLGLANVSDAEVQQLVANARRYVIEGVRPTAAPDSAAFKNWFGDSKVVDKNGKPMVVYHTGAFDSDEIISGAELKRRTGQGAGIFKSANEGIYFTKDPEISSYYGREREGATTYPVYLSIQKPFVITDKKELTTLEKLKKLFLGERDVQPMKSPSGVPKMDSMYITPAYKAELMKRGYDGIINEVYNEIVVFEPTQIKSALGNRGTYSPTESSILYRTKAAAPANALEALALDITAQPKTLREKLNNNLALQAEMQAVDMRAGLRETLKFGDDKLFTQAMYHVRKAEQKMAQMFTVMNSGPLVSYKDDKGFVGYRSSNENSARDVFDAIADIPVDDPQLKTNIAQAYMVAQRAANKGLSKLDIGELGITEEKLKAALAAADADPALKSALENVRSKYNAYNKGLIEFLASTGRISKKMAADLLKDGDYVPYYRVKGDEATLNFGNNISFNVGDIRRQPYLAELKGGEAKLLPLNEAIQRNTLLLTDMALTNNAAKSVAYGMQALGKGAGPIDPATGKPTNLMAIKKGFGPDNAATVRFYQEPDPKDPKDDGKRHIVIDTKGTAAEGIPAELVVQSLEGASLALPGFFKLGGAAADLLRAGVTRTPLYIARKLIREPMAASFTGGLNNNAFSAIFKAGAEFIRMSRGTSDAQTKLIEKGLIQSNIFAGDMSDMKKMALQLASGKDQSALDKVLAAADRYAMRADAATLALVLKNAEENGLSEVEADMMTMESMNFYKRGLSPTLQYASRLIPFFNAQIQGLNVLVKAARGNMPFEEQQQIKRKFFNNAILLMGTGLVYAMAMDDDETFRNARPRDKYSNFFLPIPGVDEPLKLPIPFEAGYFFSLAVAAVDGMRAETDGKAQFQALRDMFLGSIPGYSSMGVPQLVKPVFEVWLDKNFLTGAPVEPRRMQGYDVEERYLSTTTELAKQMSKMLPLLSPIQIEHIVRGYLGVLPLVAAAGANSLFEREGKGEKPAGRASDLPLIGSAFQKKYGGGDADVVYREAQEAIGARSTLNKMLSEGRREEAIAYRDKNKVDLAMASAAGQYRQIVGRINTDIRRTQERDDLTAEEKRLRLDALDKAKQDRADAFIRQSRAVEARLGGG
jgi:hypothetical protein